MRDGAAKLLACAIEAEVEAHLAAYSKLKLPNGQQRIVRHGHMPEREVQTGVGAIKIKAPRVRDRSSEKKICFQSGILSKYVRRTKSLEALIPWLYLKSVSSNAMQDALSALLGPDAPNLSPDMILRLTKSWASELCAANPSKPRRISVGPAANHTFVPVGSAIMTMPPLQSAGPTGDVPVAVI